MPDTMIRYGDSQLVFHKSPTLVGIRPARQDEAALARTLSRHGAVAEPQRLGSFQLVSVAQAAAPARQFGYGCIDAHAAVKAARALASAPAAAAVRAVVPSATGESPARAAAQHRNGKPAADALVVAA